MRFAAFEYRHRNRVAVVEDDGTLFPCPESPRSRI